MRTGMELQGVPKKRLRQEGVGITLYIQTGEYKWR